MENEKLHVPTMTPEEAAQAFRTAGIATSALKIRAGIEQGVYPFGICIKNGDARKFEIYGKQVMEYLKERSI